MAPPGRCMSTPESLYEGPHSLSIRFIGGSALRDLAESIGLVMLFLGDVGVRGLKVMQSKCIDVARLRLRFEYTIRFLLYAPIT